MASKQSLLKKGKNILDTRINNSWLHNVYVLYFIFIIGIGYAYYLMASSDWYYLTMFFIIGFLTSFFSKNIIVILCIALSATNILKYGVKATMEGFKEEDDESEGTKKMENMDTDENEESTKKDKTENMETDNGESEKKDKTENMETDNGESAKKNKTDSEVKEEYENPTQESRNNKKDGFKQKLDGVYTTLNDMDMFYLQILILYLIYVH